MRALAYLRTSVWRENKISIDTQRIQINKKAANDDCEIIQVFDDVGISGATTDRPGFQSLKQVIESSYEERRLYVYRYDRISRNEQMALRFLSLCEQHSVEVISVMEPLPGGFGPHNAVSKLFVQVLFSLAEFQRSILIENQQNSLKEKRRNGELLSAKVPFGYVFEYGKVYLVPQEASIVKIIFKLYATGQFGYKRLAEVLLEQGFLFRGKKFTYHMIRAIVTNPFYKGQVKGGQFNSYEGKYPPIVSKEMFQKVLEIRQSRNVEKLDTRSYILRKKLKCPYCQRFMSPKRQGKNGLQNVYYYYACTYSNCRGCFVNAETIEQEVLTSIRRFLTSKDLYPQLVTEIKKQGIELENNATKKRQKVQIQKNKLIQDYESLTIDRDSFTKQFETIKEKELAIREYCFTVEQEKTLKRLLSLKNKKGRDFLMSQIRVVYLNEYKKIKEVYLNDLPNNIYHIQGNN